MATVFGGLTLLLNQPLIPAFVAVGIVAGAAGLEWIASTPYRELLVATYRSATDTRHEDASAGARAVLTAVPAGVYLSTKRPSTERDRASERAMQRFSDILFVASPTADDAAVFERTLRLAEAHQARLTVVDLQSDAPIPPIDAPDVVTSDLIISALREASTEMLHTYEEAAGDRVPLQTRTLIGVGFVEIVRTVLREGHDLVVKTVEEADGYRHRLFGSLDMHLLRKCPVPVWLARTDEAEHHYHRLLAAIDFDPHYPDAEGDSLTRRVLEAAAGQAMADSAELHVVHAWQVAHEGLLRSRGVFAEEADAERYVEAQRALHRSGLDRIAARLREWIGAEAYDWLAPQFHLREGSATNAIPEAATELAADLVVMGTVGRTGIAGLLIGNTAETILERLDASVLALKPPGFRTPIEAD